MEVNKMKALLTVKRLTSILALLLAITMLFSACGGTESTETGDQPDDQITDELEDDSEEDEETDDTEEDSDTEEDEEDSIFAPPERTLICGDLILP